MSETIVTVPDPYLLDPLRGAPGIELRVWALSTPPSKAFGSAARRVRAVVMANRMARDGSLAPLHDSAALDLVRVVSAGVEDLLGMLSRGLGLAKAVALVLSSLRGLPEAVQAQLDALPRCALLRTELQRFAAGEGPIDLVAAR